MTPAPAGLADPRVVKPAPARQPIILVAGNPNSGKSTLFSALTGVQVRTGNYPGVTVTRTSATAHLPQVGAVEFVDLPGSYSLSARSQDEQVAVDAVLGRGGIRPDLVLVVADATALGRALYFASEIIETGGRVVIALNMIDEARAEGLSIDHERLSTLLGVPVVPIASRTREGLNRLRDTIADTLQRPSRAVKLPSLDEPAHDDVMRLAAVVAKEAPHLAEVSRPWATWLLLSIDDSPPDELLGIHPSVRRAADEIRAAAAAEGRNLDLEIIGARYAHVDALVSETVSEAAQPQRRWTNRIDAVLTHKVWGLVVFALVMLALFQALFSWSEPLIGAIETGVTSLQSAVTERMSDGPFRSLLVDGVIAGVGNVIVFVPQIAMLFLFIGVLEDAGYLARVAFVIDRVMGRVGLHGKSFVPMLSGFSCAVPAVMATRTIENRTDRMLTMMVLPLMSCSARLPIYVLVIGTVFAPGATLFGGVSLGAVALFTMYGISVGAALLAAAVLRRTVLKGPKPTLVLEMPPYRWPVGRVLFRSTWRSVRSFLTDAGTTILALTIIIWAALSYPKNAATAEGFEAQRAAVERSVADPTERESAIDTLAVREQGAQVRSSVAGRLGRVLEPVLAPLGMDWRVGVGILGAFAAREVFVSTLGIVFDIGDADEENQSLRESLREARRADGSLLFTPLSGLALMVFFVLACQCMSTIAVVRRESGSWRWPIFMFSYQTAMAYVAALIVFQFGRLMGFQ
ncbi:MAG: ferrous iron transport protein B [Acidobacteriota bacterium]|nr:ferrous iron transport protein B [Acidobacteriota bacterium]